MRRGASGEAVAFVRETGMTMLAAIPFASGFPIDAFMHGLVARLKRQGLRLGGVVQHNDATCDDRCMAMSLEDVASGRRFPISQNLGAGASGCLRQRWQAGLKPGRAASCCTPGQNRCSGCGRTLGCLNR